MTTHFAALSCPHCPFELQTSVDWALKILSDLKPRPRKLLMLGDLFDAEAASRWPDEEGRPLEEEYEHGARFMGALRGVVPYRCEYIWTHGNHDDNIQTPDPRRIPKNVRSLVDWNKHGEFGGEFRRWKQIPYEKSAEGCYQLGQVIFTHGFDYDLSSDELEGLQMAYSCGGHAFRLVIRGHTHRPVNVTQCLRTKKVPLPFWYANAGTMGTLKPPYMKRKSTLFWGPGIIVGEVDENPDPAGGRQWDAHLLTP